MFEADSIDFSLDFDDTENSDSETPCEQLPKENEVPITCLRNSTLPQQPNILDRTPRRYLNTSRQRKFPGPAGLLPDTPPRNFNDSSIKLNTSSEDAGVRDESIIYSQSSISIFSEPPFKKLMVDFDLNEPNSPLRKYTIDWVKKNALNKKLIHQKIPFLAVVVHTLDSSHPDPVMMLRDPTGELYGTLHRKVWHEMSNKVQPGSAMVLRQIGVLTTGSSRRQVYLNITFNNIISIYNTTDLSKEVSTDVVHPMTSLDLCRSIENWQFEIKKNNAVQIEAANNAATPSLFSCIPSLKNSTLTRRQSTPKPNSLLNCTSWNDKEKNKHETSECNFDLSGFDDDILDLENTNLEQQQDEHPSKDTEVQSPIVEKSSKRKKLEVALQNQNSLQFEPKFNVEIVNQQLMFRPIMSPSAPQSSQIFTPKTARNSLRSKTNTNDDEVQSAVPTLTQVESQIVNEVLSGVDFSDFE